MKKTIFSSSTAHFRWPSFQFQATSCGAATPRLKNKDNIIYKLRQMLDIRYHRTVHYSCEVSSRYCFTFYLPFLFILFSFFFLRGSLRTDNRKQWSGGVKGLHSCRPTEWIDWKKSPTSPLDPALASPPFGFIKGGKRCPFLFPDPSAHAVRLTKCEIKELSRPGLETWH